MDYLLIYPPGEWFAAGEKPVLAGQTVPPLGLLYLARTLEDEGHTVEVIDYTAETIDQKKLQKAASSADAIGMTVLTPSLLNARYLLNHIRALEPEKPLIIGGPHCSLYPQQSLRELNADVSVEGDGEAVINDVTKALEGKKSFSEIPGVHYRNKNNEIKKGPPVKLIENLDSIPFPARHLVKKYKYGQIYKSNIQKEKFTSFITSRGCPHQCRFCTRQFIGMKKYRTRSQENVIAELKELHETGYEHVVITDDSFLSGAKRAYRIMAEVIKEKLQFEFFIQGARVDSADEKLYQKMRDAGVRGISFGIESGNQDVLDFYHKKTMVQQIKKAINLSRKMKFFTMGSFILGAPFETKKHFETTIDLALSLPLDAVTFFPLDYRAGSELWEAAVNNGKIQAGEYAVPSDSQRGLALFTKDEIADYCKRAHRQFYFRPAYLLDEFAQACRRKDFTFIKAGAHVFLDNITKFFQ